MIKRQSIRKALGGAAAVVLLAAVTGGALAQEQSRPLPAGPIPVGGQAVNGQVILPGGDQVGEDPRMQIWRELDGVGPPPGYSRRLDAVDRGFSSLYAQRAEIRTFNWGLIAGGDGLSSAWVPWPGRSGQTTRMFHDWDMLFGVEEGPWLPTAQTHTQSYYWYNPSNYNRVSFEAKDGARGGQFSNPPQTRFSYPLMADTSLPDTWPVGGWPAPESVEQVWLGTETWNPWMRGLGQELYAEFNDDHATREGGGEESVLGIRVRRRAVGHASIDAGFIINEFTNMSENTYTNVFVGSTIRWIALGSYGGIYQQSDPSRALEYGKMMWYDPDAGGTQGLWPPYTESYACPFKGIVVLETPTGSMKADDLGNRVDNPDQIITRRVLVQYNDRARQSVALGRQTLYGVMSGVRKYYGAEEAHWERHWKTNVSGDGTPILMQTFADVQQEYPLYQGDGTGLTGTTFIGYWASGPVTMEPGDSFYYTVAMVNGETEEVMFAGADKAIRSYQKQFQASGAPFVPEIKVNGVLAGPQALEFDTRIHQYPIYYTPSGDITLSWDRSVAEGNPDPITGTYDFQGYRLYRSTDRGATWGDDFVTDEKGNFKAFTPYRQWDKIDGVKGKDESPGSYLSIGDDTGLVASFSMPNVVDGAEYWFSLTTYDYDDHPDPLVRQDPNVFSFEAARGRDPTYLNTVAVIAGARPNGYVPGLVNGEDLSALLQTGSGSARGYVAEGVVEAWVEDDTSVPAGTYRITTTAGATFGVMDMPNMVGVTLQNLTTGVTLYEGRVPEYFDPALEVLEENLLPPIDGIRVGMSTLFNSTDWSESANPRTSYRFPTGYGARSTANAMRYAQFVYGQPNNPDPTNVLEAATKFFSVEMRFDSTATGGQMAYVYDHDAGAGYPYRAYQRVPFTAWDVSAVPERQINVAYSLPPALADDEWNPTNTGTRATRTLFLTSDYSGTTAEATYTGGAFNDLDAAYYHWPLLDTGTTFGMLHGRKAQFNYVMPIGPGWTYEFTTTGPTISEELIDMDQIRVVPNPYFINALWDQSDYMRKIQFRNVPANSTVDIYTLAGELVASLSHEGDATAAPGTRGYYSNRVGSVEWKLWSYEYTEVAYGLYIYVVKAPNGDKKIGKFAIIR
jgi:hypothetical protein